MADTSITPTHRHLVRGTTRSGRTQAVALGGFVLLSQAAGLIGVLFTERGTWFVELDKPWFNPPGAVFAPVWTTLYVLMGIAAWLVWRAPAGPERSTALGAFAVQLALNAAWTPLFFGAHWIGWALVDIIVLLVAIAVTIALYWRVDHRASWLMTPYLAWVSFATLLNASIVVMN